MQFVSAVATVVFALKRQWRFSIGIVLAIATVASCVTPRPLPANCIAITELPFATTAPGKYCLARDLRMNTNDAQPYAIFAVSGTVIDLNGHSLEGGGQGFGVLSINAENVTVQNGRLSKFGVGVSMPQMEKTPTPHNNTVANIHFLNNTVAAIDIIGSDTVVRDNTIANTGGAVEPVASFGPIGVAYAVRVRGPGAQILNNTITNIRASNSATAYGIELIDAHQAVIRGNAIRNTKENGRSVGISIPDRTIVTVSHNSLVDITQAISKNRISGWLDPQRIDVNGKALIEKNTIKEKKEPAAGDKKKDGYRINWTPFQGKADWPMSLALTPDDRILAAGSRRGEIRLYEVSTRRLIRTLTSHAGAVHGLAYSPDGRWLISGGDDKLIKIWDPSTGNLVQTITGHDHDVSSVAFSPDGKLLASAGQDQTVRLWDFDSRKMIKSFHWPVLQIVAGYHLSVHCVAFSPDGKLLAAGGENGVRVWDVADGHERLFIDNFGGPKLEEAIKNASVNVKSFTVFNVSFSPDSRLLAWGTGGGIINIWNISSKQLQQQYKFEFDMNNTVAFTSDGTRLVSGGSGGLIVWDIIAQKKQRLLISRYPIRSSDTEADINHVQITSDDKILISSSSSTKPTIRFWDMASGTELFPDSPPTKN